jgi:prepilin-type N-terminal cleavage/methylation domain-containing protein
MPKQREFGFTIIEILVALVVVGLVGAASTATIATTGNLAGASAHYSEAVNLAQEVLEDLRTLDYDSIDDGSKQSEDGKYSVDWVVESDPALTGADGPSEHGMKLITVTVAWIWKGEDKTYELQTVFARLTPDF